MLAVDIVAEAAESEMQDLVKLLGARELTPPQEENERLATQLSALLKMKVYPRSIVARHGVAYCLAREGLDKLLCLISRWPFPADLAAYTGEERAASLGKLQLRIKTCPANEPNTAPLGHMLPFCAPKLLGVRKSFGAGDRLGIVTPAHIRAIRGTGVAPVLAQQSIREMERTGRTPQQVMSTATWGVFEEGWREGFGSDADHLKRTEDIDRCAAAGFTMFTIDPGDHVDNEAQTADAAALAQKFEALPWAELETTAAECRQRYAGQTLALPGGVKITFGPLAFLRAAAKYGKAIAHTVKMSRHLQSAMGQKPFELEMSVDETETPTTPAEHYFIASELQQLGVRWVSLAPRFVGDFEKGIDYKGSLEEFERKFIEHVAIASHFGPYKISLHSGSDKFSIYPIAARHAGQMLHVKTAGTSYLEALRAIATVDAALFRDILRFAFERYDTDRATYHVSAHKEQVRRPEQMKDDELASVLESNAGRQLLHVTYGSVLTARVDDRPRFKDRLLNTLRQHEEAHYEVVARHIRRHVEPIAHPAEKG
jgi:hypothetical protein